MTGGFLGGLGWIGFGLDLDWILDWIGGFLLLFSSTCKCLLKYLRLGFLQLLVLVLMLPMDAHGFWLLSALIFLPVPYYHAMT